MKKKATKELDMDSASKKTSTGKSRLTPEMTVDNSRPATGASCAMISGRELLANRGEKKIAVPTTLSEVDMTGLSEEERKKLVSAIRREYQRQYYQKHKEKAKEYQRQYNLTHKKKVRGGRGKASFECPREKKRMTFNSSDLMHSTSEKTLKMLKQILSGDRMFTM